MAKTTNRTRRAPVRGGEIEAKDEVEVLPNKERIKTTGMDVPPMEDAETHAVGKTMKTSKHDRVRSGKSPLKTKERRGGAGRRARS
jgi:hypothetical protein